MQQQMLMTGGMIVENQKPKCMYNANLLHPCCLVFWGVEIVNNSYGLFFKRDLESDCISSRYLLVLHTGFRRKNENDTIHLGCITYVFQYNSDNEIFPSDSCWVMGCITPPTLLKYKFHTLHLIFCVYRAHIMYICGHLLGFIRLFG